MSDCDARTETVRVVDAVPDFDALPVVDSRVVTEALAVFEAVSVRAVSVGEIVATERLPETVDDPESDGDSVALELVEMDCVGIDANGDAEFELQALRLCDDDSHADLDERELCFGELDDDSERVTCALAESSADVDAERFPVALGIAVREPSVVVVSETE